MGKCKKTRIASRYSQGDECLVCWGPLGSKTDICAYCINRFRIFDAAREGDPDHDIITAMRIGTKRDRDNFM